MLSGIMVLTYFKISDSHYAIGLGTNMSPLILLVEYASKHVLRFKLFIAKRVILNKCNYEKKWISKTSSGFEALASFYWKNYIH